MEKATKHANKTAWIIVSKSCSACLLRAARDIKNTHNVYTDDFSTGLLDLLELPMGRSTAGPGYRKTMNKPQEIPETGFCDYLIGCKDAHTVDFRGRLRFRREMAADNLVLLDRHF